jgi:quinohemoprotein amine dehydrogenase
MHQRVLSESVSWIAGLIMALGPIASVYAGAPQRSQTGLAAVRTNCSGCHRETAPGHFDRLSEERKTPEGWAMTVFRMQQVHGVRLTTDDQAEVIRYLSDVQGLAPSETAAGRFALERRPNAQDLQLPGDLSVACGRCHSLARVALQRRDAAEWLKTVYMHVGQWPTLEYQDRSRDIQWWKIATTEAPAELAKLFPLQTEAWSQWRSHAHPTLAGKWIVHGHTPGRGDYYGTALIKQLGPEKYSATYALQYATGASLDGSSTAWAYTGYQWRGTATLGGQAVREVYFASDDGSKIRGRWFLDGHSEIGGDWRAERARGAPSVVAAIPRALKTGTTQTLVLLGRGLRGPVRLGPGIRVRVTARNQSGLILAVTVAPGAACGYRTVRIGSLRVPQALAVYGRIDRVMVEPSFAIARLGGGTLAPVDAQFAAIAYAKVAGPGGKREEIRLGEMPAAWGLEPFDAQAARGRDIHFAGTLSNAGRFEPAGAGPDPARPFSADNTGNLLVTATLADGAAPVRGQAHLVVTVQRWINPAIY